MSTTGAALLSGLTLLHALSGAQLEPDAPVQERAVDPSKISRSGGS